MKPRPNLQSRKERFRMLCLTLPLCPMLFAAATERVQGILQARTQQGQTAADALSLRSESLRR